MEIYFGENLQKLVKSYGVENYQKRDIFSDLQQYINSDNDKRVCALYGLRRTGKTTLMMQSLLEQNIDDCMLILCSEEDDTGTLKRELNQNKDYNIIYIDEVTKLNNFVNTASILSDHYAILGKKIILSGTDSYALELASRDELYDRCHLLHTTYISFKEYNRLLNKNIDEYIRFGGTLTDGKTFYNKDSEEKYLNSSIVNNIKNSLAQIGRDGEFGVLSALYYHDEFTSFLQKIIELNNRSFFAKTVNKTFKSHDMGSLYDLLSKSKEVLDEDFSFLTSMELREKIRLSLEIKEPLLTKVTDKMIEAAIKHLKWADVIYPIPNSDEVIFTQPGLRYSQLENEMETLKNFNDFSKCSLKARKILFDKLESDIKGRMLEDIIFYQLAKDENISNNYYIFKYQTEIFENNKHQNKEIDIVLRNKITCDSYWLEVKYSKIQYEKQIEHLNNADLENKFLSDIGARGAKVIRKFILYRGETSLQNGEISYVNVSDFLIDPYNFLNDKEYYKEQMRKNIKLQDYSFAYSIYGTICNSKDKPLSFMKEVIKNNGINGDILASAVETVTDCEYQDCYFKAKLLQDTLNTEEYKQAFAKEQGQSKATEYTK